MSRLNYIILTLQAADHPYLVEYSTSAIARGTSKNIYNNEQACGLCHDVAEEPMVH